MNQDLIAKFTSLSYSDKKWKLLLIVWTMKNDLEGARSLDIIDIINSLPDWSDNILIDIYSSFVKAAQQIRNQEKVILSIDRWIDGIKKYRNDLEHKEDQIDADLLLNSI